MPENIELNCFPVSRGRVNEVVLAVLEETQQGGRGAGVSHSLRRAEFRNSVWWRLSHWDPPQTHVALLD